MTIDDAREDFMNDVYNTLDFLPTNNEANRIIDSFDRVTSGLEQKPCEDCVSRQAVLDIIMPYCQDDDGSVENTGDLRNALDDIESLPPITPKEKTGTWQIIEGLGYYTCSVCKCDSDVNLSYCPNCGAKMEGEELVEFDEEEESEDKKIENG